MSDIGNSGDEPPVSKPRDILAYSGQVSRAGYEAVCAELSKQSANNLLLVLSTPGGDPNAGFRIARALQHHYESFEALIPWLCKSAGTLICIGASCLWLDDQSELGPLDVQVKKEDEIIGRNSGLDILQAVNYLQTQAMAAFRTYLIELTAGAALSTRVASEISSKLTTGLFSPIFAQIDPMRLAEMQRATDIAFAYGERLNKKSQNLRQDGLEKLVVSYPSHGFVIDRKEAGTIFTRVRKPEGLLAEISKALYASMKPGYDGDPPKVMFVPASTIDTNRTDGDQYADLPDSKAGTGSDDASGTEDRAGSQQIEQLCAHALFASADGKSGSQIP